MKASESVNLIDPRTPNIKANLIYEFPVKETSVYPCPIPEYKPVPKK